MKAKEDEIARTMSANLTYLNAHPDEYAARPVAWNLAASDPGTDQQGHPTDGQSGHDTLGADERTA
ncbi:hypothetical protein G5V59_11430 [Nocardioides sp. W3-2-3]|uniref:hypothetical protein n=1 Tax=Nocardioides convexus TaxID=2712224 RepID=UPI002418ADE4|nr:hypothetical protein [Nocardioides convexus]NHA00457.1 hypothetical protein [Nocardioides convexus]